MTWDAVVIGSGLGGLLSSILLARAQKRVLVLEQHRIPGGCCTSYRRGGFTFNVPSVMSDLGPGEVRRTLEELGFYDQVEWTTIDNFARCSYPDLEVVMPANDLDGCRQNLLRAFPSESRAVDTLFADIRTIQKGMAALGRGARGLFDLVRTVPRLVRLSRVSFNDYLRRYTTDEKLVTVASSVWGFGGLPPGQSTALNLLVMCGECWGKPTRFPKDGFQSVSDFLAGKLLELGGEIRYRAGVNRILVENNRATGVELSTGEQICARVVISNADTKKTFLRLVGESSLSRRFVGRISSHTPSFSGLSLHLGVDLDLSAHDLDYGSVFFHESWESADRYYQRANANQIDFATDPIALGVQAPSLLSSRLAPPGQHVVHILVGPVHRSFMADFGTEDGARGCAYRETKKRLTAQLVAKVEKLIPGVQRSVVVSEMATPFTFERYTGASGGAWYDGVSPVGGGGRRPSCKTPVANLYCTGTKAFGGGGMPPALMGGMAAAKAVLAAG